VCLAGVGFGLLGGFDGLEVAGLGSAGVDFHGGGEGFGGIGVHAFGGGQLGPGYQTHEQVGPVRVPGMDCVNVTVSLEQDILDRYSRRMVTSLDSGLRDTQICGRTPRMGELSAWYTSMRLTRK